MSTANTMVQVRFGSGVLSILIDFDQQIWRMARPFLPDWKRILGGVAGRLEFMSATNRCTLFDRFDRRRLQLSAFTPGGQVGTGGEAIWNLNLDFDKTHALYTSWVIGARQHGAKHLGAWAGVAVKGSVGAVIGTEDAAGIVWSLDNPGKAMTFIYSTTRAGAVGGFSGAISFSLMTGVHSQSDLANFATSGTDWALAVGTPLAKGAGLVKNFAGYLNSWGLYTGKIARYAEVVEVCAKHKDQLVTLGKDVLTASSFDPDTPAVSFLDLPGPGIEAGFYWYWAAIRGVSSIG